jgi:uncharacterized protein (PEP-CTERM system associated)
VQTSWRPSERTQLTGYRENRLFGSGWRIGFDHRMPQLAWNVQLSRGIQSALESLFGLPATDNVAGLLDAMFTTRYPDPVERARAVQEFIARQGLPAALVGPTTLYSQRLSLVTSRTASVALIGARNALSATVFNVRVEDVADLRPLDAAAAIKNNVQYGGAIALSHRLSPTANVSATIDYSRIRALATVAADESKQAGATLQLSLQAAPKTTASFGARYRRLASNVAANGEEVALFVGLDQRF